MSKTMKQNNLRTGLPTSALILTMTLSMAAFGCSTNHFRTAGEPVSATPAVAPMTVAPAVTPGSAGPAIPTTMISAAVDRSVDAIAILEAQRGYQGRVLGPAAPGPALVAGQFPTGQFISPSVLANPQLTINSSISSPASVPAIVSGRAGGITVDAATGLFNNAVVLPNVGNAATTVGANANFGVTGTSTTTATGLTTFTAPATTVNGTSPVVGAPVRVDTTSGNVVVTNTTATTNTP